MVFSVCKFALNLKLYDMKTRIIPHSLHYRGQIMTTFFLLSLFLMTATAFAQDQQRKPKGPPPPMDEKQMEKMIDDIDKKLSLTSEQKEKITVLMSEHFKEMKEVREKFKKSRDAEKSEMDSLKTKFDEDMNSVLTEDQQVLFKEFMKEKRPDRDEKGKRGKMRDK